VEDQPKAKPPRPASVYVEDAVIIASVLLLFVLTVFFRRTLWGQLALVGLLIVMVVVLVRRLRRTHRALRGRE